MADPLFVTASLTIPAADLAWSAVRASGPGGQNVNKVASKVELRFDVARTTALDGYAKERLRALAGSRMDALGVLLITSQLTRDQSRNLEDARQKLAELVRLALVRPKTRRATRPSRAAVRARLDDKRHHANKKRQRRDGDD
jgi:ribosome-associated protein